MRLANILDSLTPVKFFVYVVPAGCALFAQHYMVWVALSIIIGVLLARSREEKAVCIAMLAVWIIWGQSMGPWVPEERRGSWMVMIGIPIGFHVSQRLEQKRRQNAWLNEGRD